MPSTKVRQPLRRRDTSPLSSSDLPYPLTSSPNRDGAAEPDIVPKKVDLGYLQQYKVEKQNHFAVQDQQILRMRRVRTLTNDVPIDAQMRFTTVEVRDPTIADETGRVSATITMNPPACHVYTITQGDTDEEESDKLSRFNEAVLEVAGTRVEGLNTYEAAGDACVGDGGAWTKFLFVNDLWDTRYDITEAGFVDDGEETPKTRRKTASQKYDEATEEAKKQAGPPFVWLNCDAQTIYPEWSGGKIQSVMEITERPILETFRRWNLNFNAKGKIIHNVLGAPFNEKESHHLGNKVEFLEHWDDTWATWAVVGGDNNGQIVKQFEHGYKRPPYFYAPGLTFGWHRGRKVGWSIGESKRWLTEYRSFLHTVHAQVVARDAIPPLFRERPLEADQIIGSTGQPRGTSPERYQLGMIYEGEPGEKLNPVQFQETSGTFKDHLQIVDNAIDRLTTPRVNAQIGSGGLEGAGFAINQVLAEAKIQQNPFTRHLAQMLTEITRFMWSLIRNVIGETVWVYTTGSPGRRGKFIGVGPNDLKDAVRIVWELDPEQPTAEMMLARYWHERLQNQTASLDQAIAAMGDSPREVRIGRTLDEMRQAPWYKMKLQQNTLHELGRGDILVEAAALAAQNGELVDQTGQNIVHPSGTAQSATAGVGSAAAAATPGAAGATSPGGAGTGGAGEAGPPIVSGPTAGGMPPARSAQGSAPQLAAAGVGQ